ncbi:MAG: hypothetical protein HC916_14035 [Coleofasciculaceae cyanobacterium SM2_1_6]|nr:hypothetical protein [Coleofasciculaceae cyanobacterium SM2_1_6]
MSHTMSGEFNLSENLDLKQLAPEQLRGFSALGKELLEDLSGILEAQANLEKLQLLEQAIAPAVRGSPLVICKPQTSL